MDNRYNHRYNHHNRRKYSLKVHIVLVTKYRKQLLTSTIAEQCIRDSRKYIMNRMTVVLSSG